MKEKKKILIICPHPQDTAPGQRLKYEQYFSSWENNGYDIFIDSFMTQEFWEIVYKKGNIFKKIYWTIVGYFKRLFSIFSIRKYDAIYIFLWVTPFGLPIFEWIYTKLARKIIYDIDDMVFLGHSSDANSFIQSLKGRRKMIFLMKKANHVITCTPSLDEFVRKFNKNTTDISSTVDTDNRFKLRQDYRINDEIILGWTGSHSTSKYLYLLKDVLKQISKKYNIKLIVMGDSSFNIDGVNIEAIEWKEEYEVEILERFDIGLYPLPNEPWVYGKSGSKAIIYMALGIPTVAAAIGANFRIIKNENNGFLVEVDNEKEWYNRIEQLILSQELRERLGKEGRKTIVENYSIKANKQRYLDVFSSVL